MEVVDTNNSSERSQLILNWVKRLGGQSDSSIPNQAGLEYHNSNVYFMGNIFPAPLMPLSRLSLVQQQLHSPTPSYQTFLSSISTSGSWGSVAWTWRRGFQFVVFKHGLPQATKLEYGGKFKSTTYQSNFSWLTFSIPTIHGLEPYWSIYPTCQSRLMTKKTYFFKHES